MLGPKIYPTNGKVQTGVYRGLQGEWGWSPTSKTCNLLDASLFRPCGRRACLQLNGRSPQKGNIPFSFSFNQSQHGEKVHTATVAVTVTVTHVTRRNMCKQSNKEKGERLGSKKVACQHVHRLDMARQNRDVDPNKLLFLLRCPSANLKRFPHET